MATKKGGSDLNLKANLGLTVSLDNFKEIENQLKNLKQKIKVAGDAPSKSDPTAQVKNGNFGSFVEQANREIAVALKALRQSKAQIQKYEGKDVSGLTGAAKKKYDDALGGYRNAMTGLSGALKSVSKFSDDIRTASGAPYKKAAKELTDEMNSAAGILAQRTGLDKKSFTEAQKTQKEKQAQTALSKEQTRLQKASNTALKLNTKQQEQKLKEQSAAGLVGAPVGSLTSQQRGAVKDALAGRVAIAKQREGVAVARGDVSPQILSRLTEGRIRATTALQNYNDELTAQSKIEKTNAAQKAKIVAEERAYNQQAQLDQKGEKRIRNVALAELAAYEQVAKQKKAVIVAEERAYNQQAQIQQKGEKRIRDLALAEIAAYEQVANSQKKKVVAEQRAYADQEKIASKEAGRIRSVALAELAAYKTVEDRAEKKGKAEERAYKEQERRDAANEKRIRNVGLAEIAAYEKVAEVKRKADTAAFNEANRRAAQEDKLRPKRAIATEIAQKYGAATPEQLNVGRVSREDIGALQSYAKAKLSAADADLKHARSSQASAQEIGQLTQRQATHAQEVARVDKAYRALNHPLAQATLLFRQFFRFAIGYGALYQVLGAVTALTRGILDLDESLKSIQAVSGATISQMADMEIAIKRVAVTTKFTVAEVAKATEILAQAGTSVADIPAALQAVADFAAGTSSSLEVAADLITTTKEVFENLDYQTLADQLTKSVNISKLNASDLQTILSLSAQTAESYNLTSEQYLAAVTTLRNAGIKASTVATGLRQAMIEVFSPSTKAIKIITERYRQLGDNLTEEVVRQRFFGFTKDDNPLLAVLSELRRIGFADDAQKELGRAFNVRATNVLIPLIKNLDEVAAAESRITFGAAAAEAAEIQMESLRASLENLGAAFTVLGDVILGDGVDSLQKFIDKITEALGKLVELDTQLKLQGKEGLSGALLPALLGATGGALAGRGKLGRTALAGVGGAAGAYAGTQEAGDGGVASTLTLGLLGASALQSIPAVGGKLAELFTKKAIVEGEKKAAAVTGGFIAKWAAKFAASRALGVAAVSWVNPLVGLIVNGGLLAYAAYTFFSDPPSGVEAANNKAQGAVAKLDATKAELAKLEQEADQFDISKAKAGDTTGKAANSIVDYGEDFRSAQESIQSVFGDISESAAKEFKEKLVDYAKANLARRRELGAEIESKFPTGLDGEEFDRVVSSIALMFETLQDSGDALAQQFSEKFNKAQERVQRAVAQGEDLTKGDIVNDVALLKLFADSEDYQNLIRNNLDSTAKGYSQILERLSQAIADIDKVARDELAKTKVEEEKQKAKLLIEKALKESKETKALVLESLMNSMITSGVLVGQEAQDYLSLIDEVLKEKLGELQQEYDKASAAVEGAKGQGNARQGVVVGEAAARLAENRAKQESLQRSRDIVAKNQARQQAADDKKKEEAARSDQAAINEFATNLGTKAGRGVTRRNLEEQGGELNEAIKGIVNSPENAVEAANEALSGVLSGLTKDSYEIGPDGKARLKAEFKKQREAISLATSVNVSSVAARQGEDEIARLSNQIVDPALISRKAELESAIKRANSSDKGGRDGSPALVQQLAEVDRQIQQFTINKLENEIEALGSSEDDAFGPDGVANARKRMELQGQLAKARGDYAQIQVDADDQVLKIAQDTERDRIKKAKEVAKLNIDMANRQIELSGASTDVALFNQAIDTINANREKLRSEIRNELLIEGFHEGTELFDQELEAREFILRDITENAGEFISAVEKLTSGLNQLADIVEKTPVTLGLEQDALSERAGTTGDARRRQEVVSQSAAQILRRQAATDELARYESEKKAGNFSEPGEAEQINNQILKTQNEIYGLDQSLESLALTARENSEIATVRGEEEIRQLMSLTQLTEALEDSDYAFKNFAENLRGIFLDAIDGMADAIATAVIEGGNFQELMVNLFQQIAQDMLSSGLKTLFNEVILQSLPAAAAGGVGKVLGIGAEAATGAAADAAEGAVLATTVTAALLPASTSLGAAGTAMFGAMPGFITATGILGTAASALLTAAGTLGASSVASGAGDSIASGLASAFVRTGGIFSRSGIKRYAGGLITGPGTGTSDSIPAFHIDGKTVRPIAVSNGESILTEKATDFLGEKFILGINSGNMKGFSGGAVMSRQKSMAAAAKPSAASPAAAPVVNNQTSTTIVNAVDSPSVLAAGLEAPSGSRVVMNFMRANKQQIKRILG